MIGSAESKAQIGLNLLFLRPGRVGGTETYARGLVEGFLSLRLPYRFSLFLNSEAYPTFAELDSEPNFQRILCSVPLNPSLRHVWEQIYFPGLIERHSLDLFHSLANVIPFRTRCKTIVTIHDLLYKVFPSGISFMRRNVLGALTTASARRADLIISVSHNSQNDIEKYLHIPGAIIHVTPEGPGQTLQVVAPWEEVRRKYQVPEPYFLTVGTAPHKRVDRIVLAARILREERKFPVSVVTTSPTRDTPGGNGIVKHFGFVPPEDLACLYKHAIALICFSDMEGFGLTPLEAMGLGTPVVASNAAAIPEVFGDGGIIVEHGDTTALAEAMWNIAIDKRLQTEVRERGHARVANFSWMGCAAETARAYAEVLGKGTR
ncbi:MAG TPA: glycosyltransferase family 1 protein [Candidatus Koribacter sp.]|jgi:glycosyltransferase involved in cell wall biosynthesis